MFLKKKKVEKEQLKFKKQEKKRYRSNDIVGNVLKQIDNLKNIEITRTAQKTIPYKKIYKNGMINVVDDFYSIVIKFSNISYSLSREDEQEKLFKKYCNLLNALSPDIHYQEVEMNKAIDEEVYKEILLPKEEKEGKIHSDYVKVQSNFISESTSAAADKEMYIALGYRMKNERDNPYKKLRKAFRTVSLELKRVGSTATMLKPYDIYELLYSYLNPGIARDEKFYLPENFRKMGRSDKDFIAPSSFRFKKGHIEMGNAVTRIFYVKNYPDSVEDTFIQDVLDNSYDIWITKHVDHVDKADAITTIKRRRTTLEQQKQEKRKKNSKEGTDYIPIELEESIDETKKLMKQLQDNEEMFQTRLYLSISARDMDELEDISETILSTCRKHLISIEVVAHRQEAAMASMLPLGYDAINIGRKLTTSQTAVFIPFNTQNIFDESGFYYGRNSLTNSMVIVDRKKLKNGNGFVLGVPGSGKSFKEKREIIDVMELLNSDTDDVIIIDPEREFGGVCEKYKGELIRVSASTNTHLNPFDITLDYADEDDPLQMKSDFIISIVETVKGTLSAIEKTIIDRCVKLTYEEFIKSGWNQELIPTFQDFYNIVKLQKEKEAKDIALAIELYVVGSLNTFSHKSNVTLKNRLTVFDTKDLGKQLKKVGLLIVLDYVWNILCKNKEKGKNTWIVTDEFYLYFDDRDDKDSYSAEYYYMIYKRSRKYGGLVTGITQNVEDLLQSPKARTMLANSEFIILLDQAYTDRVQLKTILNLSETQENFITNAESGCGLMIVGKNVIPIEDQYPQDNEIYRTITTKLADIRKYKEEGLKGA